jgi:hypothetical protein
MFTIVRSKEAGLNSGVTGSKPKCTDGLNYKDVNLGGGWRERRGII